MSDVDIDIEILYICSGAEECHEMECTHRTPHICSEVNTPCYAVDGVNGSKCNVYKFDVKISMKHAQELLNSIDMAENEGVVYVYTEKLAKKLGEFINGGV